MESKSLIEELIEDKELDNKIIKSFKFKNSLPKNIFNKVDESYELKEDIRKKLLEVSHTFLEFIGVDIFIHDVVLTGSLANYNWSEYSDVDLHLMVDMNEFDSDNKNSGIIHSIVKEFFDSKKNIWNTTHDIKIKGYEVEIYVQDINEPHISSGVYSILNGEWIVEPKKMESPNELDERVILEKGEEYGKQIDDLLKRSELGDDVTEESNELKNKIKRFRQSGLEKGGEYSYENLTFKLLRRNGYIEKLLGIKTKIINKKLSITQ